MAGKIERAIEMNEQRRNACFIIPYFGKLPETFPVYLRTCAENPDYDWLIVTDDRAAYDYPENVHVSYTSFDAFVEQVQSHFDFPIALKRPYKICDFRAAFGEIFAEELQGYRFWGHCDLDQYFGKISHFISDEVLDSYEKILCLGHFTLFRNIPRINGMYKIPDRKWGQSYQDAFSQEKHWIFDEWPSGNTCINRIMKQEGVKTFYCHDAFCDLVPFVSRFQRYIFDHEAEDWVKEDIPNSIYIWKEGKLFACHKGADGQVVRREMLYVHIRQRAMSMHKFVPGSDAILFVPNRIISLSDLTDQQAIRYLNAVRRRAAFHPDEISRKIVEKRTMCYLAVRKIKRTIIQR